MLTCLFVCWYGAGAAVSEVELDTLTGDWQARTDVAGRPSLAVLLQQVTMRLQLSMFEAVACCCNWASAVGAAAVDRQAKGAAC